MKREVPNNFRNIGFGMLRVQSMRREEPKQPPLWSPQQDSFFKPMVPAKVIKNRLCDIPSNLFGVHSVPNRNWLSDHVLQEMFTDPYPGMSGALCDLCGGQINIASGFYHCNICEKDMCKNCERSFCNEQKCMKKITEDPYVD